jgi:general secretion pathway protein G
MVMKKLEGKMRGFTLVELMVVLAVIALLLSVVVPDYMGKMRRAEEAVLQENLALMRDSLDKHYADTGRYPTTLEELVAKHYLRSIPKDPFTQSASTWVPVPPQDARKGNVWDVKSAAKGYERY